MNLFFYSFFSFKFPAEFVLLCIWKKIVPIQIVTHFFFVLILGVIVQFSTNNGVQWQFLRELDFSSFLEPQVVTIELPAAAKTPYTVFRWWQPQQG